MVKTGMVPASLRFPAVGEGHASNAVTRVHMCAHMHTHGAAEWGTRLVGEGGPGEGSPSLC